MNTPFVEKNNKKSFLSRIPKLYIVLYAAAAISAIIYIIAINVPAFSDFFNRYISSVVRAVLAYFTNWIPFSFAEAILIAVPVLLIVLTVYAIKKYSDSWSGVLIYFIKILSVVSVLFTMFVWGFGTAYHGTPLDKKLGLERKEISVEELKQTAEILVQEINKEIEEIYFIYDGFSIMPYSYSEMNDKLLSAYDKVCSEYPFIQNLYSRVKPVMLSEIMSYTHITGVYSYFTGEANINVNFPDYTIPYTAAHELAHQRGIAREDEANVVAFIVCSLSDDPYIRYSGYLKLYEYVSSALYSADSDAYYEILADLESPVISEMEAYSEFYDKYRDSTVGVISGMVNDTYLKFQGTSGTKSYGMVVDLAVAYYNSKK